MGQIPPFYTSWGPASATAGGYLTNGTQTIAGAKTFANAVTITDAGGGAEVPLTIQIDGLATAGVFIENSTGSAGAFGPIARRAATTTLSNYDMYQGATDTGTNVLCESRARIGTSTSVATRNLFGWNNNTTRVMTLSAVGGLAVTGGSAPSISVGTAMWRSGAGSPEAAVTGNVGDMYSRTDGAAGTCLYIKESGAATNTGWVAK